MREGNPGQRTSAVFRMDNFPRSYTLPVAVYGAAGERLQEAKGQDKLADV